MHLSKLTKKSKFKSFIILFGVISVLFLFSACGSDQTDQQVTLKPESTSGTETTNQSTSDNTVETTAEPEPYYIPDFKLTTLGGEETSLSAYEGQLIVINFWATWCKYCIEEMPLLDELDKRDDVTVLAISVNEDQKTVQDYIDEHGYQMPIFLDEKGELASMFGVTGFPTSLFLGPDFEYFYLYPGMLEQNTIDSILEAIDEIMKDRQ